MDTATKQLRIDGNLLSDGISSLKWRRQQLELLNYSVCFSCAVFGDDALDMPQADKPVDAYSGDRAGGVDLALAMLARVENRCGQHGE